MITAKNKLLTSLFIVLYLIGGLFSQVLAQELIISGNGSESVNVINVVAETETNVEQTSTAEVTNDVTTDSNTGNNDASSNTDGDVSVTTGAIDDSVLVTNDLNVSEVDLGCCGNTLDASITGNGADSLNTINVDAGSEININSDLVATVTNTVEGSSNTGGNTATDNAGGDVGISTGDINVEAGVTNIVNGLTVTGGGAGICVENTDISGNGAGSVNVANINSGFVANVNAEFFEDVTTFLNWDPNTGDNDASSNTGGDVWVETGGVSLSLFTINDLNRSFIDLGGCCCDLCDPADPGDPGDPGDSGTGGSTSEDSSSDDSQDDSVVGGFVLAAATGGAEILGLSYTGSGTSDVLYLAGMMIMVFGIAQTGKGIFDLAKK